MFGFEFEAGSNVATKLALVPASSELGPFTEKEKLLPILTITDACRDGSATLVAVKTSLEGDGTICGAVTRPLALTVPHAAPLQPGPLSDHNIWLAG